MSIRVLLDDEYNKLCTWAATARLSLRPGENVKGLIETMRQDNISCAKTWYGEPAIDPIDSWEFSPDYSYDMQEILKILDAFDYNIDVDCVGLAIAGRLISCIQEGVDTVSRISSPPQLAAAEGEA
jgi:hypothetical protein